MDILDVVKEIIDAEAARLLPASRDNALADMDAVFEAAYYRMREGAE